MVFIKSIVVFFFFKYTDQYWFQYLDEKYI